MHLNQVCDIFMRKHTLLETVNMYGEDLYQYASTRVNKAIILINDHIYFINA